MNGRERKRKGRQERLIKGFRSVSSKYYMEGRKKRGRDREITELKEIKVKALTLLHEK